MLSESNLQRLRTALGDLNPRHRMTPQRLSFLDVPPPGQSVQNLYLQTNLGTLDILSTVTGVGDFSRLRERAETIEVDGRRFAVMALDDLIAAKEALGREKDLLTAKELRAISAKRSGYRRSTS